MGPADGVDKPGKTWQEGAAYYGTISMNTTLALHLGAHKTATTTIQREFDQRRRELIAHGVAFFGPSLMRGIDDVVYPSPNDVRDGLETEIQQKTSEKLLEVIHLQAERRSRILVSEENVLGSPRLNVSRRILYMNLQDRLRALPQEWNKPDTQIFLAIRDYASFFASCQSTVALLGGWIELGPHQQEKLAALPRRWPDVIRDIQAVFPASQIVVWRFEDIARVGQDAINRMVGAPFELNFRRKSSMESLTAEGMGQLRELFANSENGQVPKEQIRAIRAATEELSGKYDPWRPDLKEQMQQAYRDDWSAIQSMGSVTSL